MSDNISSVSEAVLRTGGAAAQVLTAASELYQRPGQLQKSIDKFLIDMRAA